MTAEELFLKVTKESGGTQRLYERTMAIPTIVHGMIAYFRGLCVLGGRVPVPVVAIEEEGSRAWSAHVNDLVVPGRGIVLQVLFVQPLLTEKVLMRSCNQCRWSTTETCLRFACHEARHCLQRARVVACCHGAQWLRRWFEVHGPSDFLYFGDLVHNPQILAKHADSSLSPTASRRERQRKRAREHDAEATAIACTACWRMTHDLQAVTQLLHSE